MKECNCGRIPPCYVSLERAIYEEAKKVNEEWKKSRALYGKMIDKLRGKLMEGGFLDDTYEEVYGLNKQMCDLDIPLRNTIKPLSDETAQELIGRWEEIGKEWASKKKEIIESIFGNITNEKSNIMEEKKTKKMTKAEAFEWLKCKKVATIGLGKEVQKKLFDCGVKWANGKCEYYDFSDYLLIEHNGDLYHCGNCGEAYWRAHHFEEIYAHDILSMEIIDENKTEEEKALDKISCLGAQIVDILLRMKGHHHVIITETSVDLHDEGMSLFHSDPF